MHGPRRIGEGHFAFRGRTMTDQNLKRAQEWLKPSTLVAAMGLMVSLFIFFSSSTRDSATAQVLTEKRLSTIEATLNIRVIPTLDRIERSVK